MFASRLKLTVGPSYCKWRAWSSKKKVYYAVGKGKKVGVFETWEECESNIKGYSNARFQKFATPEEAERFVHFWEEYTKLVYIELNSLKEKNRNCEKETMGLKKNLTQVTSEMSLLKTDFQKIKNAISSASRAWYQKKLTKKSNCTQNKREGNLGFASFKSKNSK